MFNQMENLIPISNINDFIFCPISIYFHNLYKSTDDYLYKDSYQLNGTRKHEAIDNGAYSSKKNCLMSIHVFSEKYWLIGKIDLFDMEKGELIERKAKINKIYDGYILQLYAQYYCLIEMGYSVKKLSLYSYEDNKKYNVLLPEEDEKNNVLFQKTIDEIMNFNPFEYVQTNREKCLKCIYSNACDRSMD